jgi:hypothetical protein
LLLLPQVRFGELTDQSIRTLRLLRDAFGVTFKIKEMAGTDEESGSNSIGARGVKKEEELSLGKTVLLSCLGTGYINMSRRIK